MTGERPRDLPPAQRRRLIAWAVLRSVVIAAVLVALYYVLPLDRPWDSDTAVRLLIRLPVFAGFMVWQIRTIAGARYPGLRAAEALALALPFFLLLFSSAYFLMERASAASFTQPLTRTDVVPHGDRGLLLRRATAAPARTRRGSQPRSDDTRRP